eukprot:Gb_37116 [translate_table: standard]
MTLMKSAEGFRRSPQTHSRECDNDVKAARTMKSCIEEKTFVREVAMNCWRQMLSKEVDIHIAKCDAKCLNEVREGRVGTDEATMIEIFYNLNKTNSIQKRIKDLPQKIRVQSVGVGWDDVAVQVVAQFQVTVYRGRDLPHWVVSVSLLLSLLVIALDLGSTFGCINIHIIMATLMSCLSNLNGFLALREVGGWRGLAWRRGIGEFITCTF